MYMLFTHDPVRVNNDPCDVLYDIAGLLNDPSRFKRNEKPCLFAFKFVPTRGRTSPLKWLYTPIIYTSKFMSGKFMRVSLNKTPEFPFWGVNIYVDFNFRNQKTKRENKENMSYQQY